MNQDRRSASIDDGLDFTIETAGNIVLLRPASQAARGWLADHVKFEGWPAMAVIVCTDETPDLVEEMRRDGLRIPESQ